MAATKAKYIQQKEVIAIDFVALYKALADSGEIPTIRSQAAFDRAWVDTQLECLHYTAASLSDAEGYVDSIIMQLLDVAAAYLHLDPWQAPTALGFGLFLVSYLYFTQPSVLPPLPPVASSSGGDASNVAAPATGEDSSERQPRTRRRHKIKVGVDAFHTMLERIPFLANHQLLKQILASLVADEAFLISPHVDNGPSMVAIVTAHSLFECPLVDVKRLKKETAMLSKQIKKDIGEIERRISQQAGGSSPLTAGSIGNDDDDCDLRSALLAAVAVGPSASADPTMAAASANSSARNTFIEPPDFGTDRAAMRSILIKKDQYLQMRKGLL